MLTLTVNLFNFIGGTLNIIFLSSYSLGKVMFTFSYQAVKMFFSFIISIGNSIWLLFEEFHIFCSDVSANINKFSLSVSEGAAETMTNIQQGSIMLKDKAILYATRKLGIVDFCYDLVDFFRYVLNLLLGAISLLSDIMWFVVMIVPNMIWFLISSLISAIQLLLSSILLGCSTLTSLAVEVYTLIVFRLKNKPVRTVVEATILFLLITNSLLLLAVARQLIRFLNRILMHLASKIRNSPYLRLQSDRYRHSSRARSTIEPRRSAVLSPSPIQPRSAIRQSSSTQNKTASNKNDTEEEGSLCVICQERQRCIVLFPCKHLCLCDDCADCLASYQNTCPLCRIYINNQLRIYV